MIYPRVKEKVDGGPRRFLLYAEWCIGMADVVGTVEVAEKASLLIPACGTRIGKRIVATNGVLL